MADATKTAPVAAPATPGTAVPAAVAKPKKERVVHQTLFGSEELATAAAGERTKGPRRAFKCTMGDKVFHIVAHNEGRAGGVAFEQIGGKVEEVGKVAKAKKAVGVDGIMTAVQALPEAERKAILEQLAALTKAPAKAAK